MTQEERNFSRVVRDESYIQALTKGQLELKAELQTALDRLEKYREDYYRADDAASYWKENFEQLFNGIVRSVTADGEELTDGEVVDQIFDTLKKYQGESDEQIKINL